MKIKKKYDNKELEGVYKQEKHQKSYQTLRLMYGKSYWHSMDIWKNSHIIELPEGYWNT